MFRGEVYGYTHYFHLNFVNSNSVKFLWQDVICKYWPWAKRVTSENEKMALETTKQLYPLCMENRTVGRVRYYILLFFDLFVICSVCKNFI